MPTGGSAPFLIAGFGLTWAGLVLYAWRLEARLDDARERLERRDRDGSRVRAPESAGGADDGSSTTEEVT